MKRFLHFWELKGSYILVGDAFWKKILKYKKELLFINNIKNYYNQYKNPAIAQYIPLEKLIYLSNFIGFDVKIIEKKNLIKAIKFGKTGKPIFNLKFPIDFLSKEWAYIVGGMLSEGSICKYESVNFWNNNYDLVIKFNTLMKKVLNINSVVRKKKEIIGGYHVIYPKIVAKILIRGLGMKKGKKIINDPCIPKLYVNLDLEDKKNKKIVGGLLSWLYSGDGGIYLFKDCNNRTQRCIGLGFSNSSKEDPSRLVKDSYYLLKKFGINPEPISLNKIWKNRKSFHGYHWRFFIRGKQNFELFKEYINFEQLEKRKILNNAIKSYVKPNLKKGEALFKLIKCISKKQSCGVHEIAKDFFSTKEHVSNMLRKARYKKLIRVVGGGNRINGARGGRYPYIYEVTFDGLKYLEDIGSKFL